MSAQFQQDMQHENSGAGYNELQVEEGFTLQDIQQGIKAAQDLYGIHIEEENDEKTSQRELLRKYAELSTFSQFLKTFDTTVFNKLQGVN